MICIIEEVENVLYEMNLSNISRDSFIITYKDEEISSEGFGINHRSLEIVKSIFFEGLYWNYYENRFYNFDTKNQPLHYGGILFPNESLTTQKLFDQIKNFKLFETKKRILKKKGVEVNYNIEEPALHNIVFEKYVFNYKKVDDLIKEIENMYIYIGGGWFNGYWIIYSKNIEKAKQDFITRFDSNLIKFKTYLSYKSYP